MYLSNELQPVYWFFNKRQTKEYLGTFNNFKVAKSVRKTVMYRQILFSLHKNKQTTKEIVKEF